MTKKIILLLISHLAVFAVTYAVLSYRYDLQTEEADQLMRYDFKHINALDDYAQAYKQTTLYCSQLGEKLVDGDYEGASELTDTFVQALDTVREREDALVELVSEKDDFMKGLKYHTSTSIE